jgi:putative hydroxymethylpyrimidine transport system substrate-binding protein
MTRSLPSIATIATLALGLAACGEKKEALAPAHSKPLTLMLDYFPNADHVGIYQALAEGDFSRAGLDLHVQTPSDPLSLVSIGAIVQKPLTSIVSIGAKRIRTPAQLRGKRVGDSGIPYQHAYLTTILQQAGVPLSSVKETNVGFDLVPAMLSGRVDATLGAYWNYEAIELAQLRKRPNVIRVDQVGVPTYDELVLVVTSKTLASKADQLRSFVQAIARGYGSARSDPRTAVNSLLRATTGLDSKLQLASTLATLPAFFPSDPTKPWGWQDPTAWNAYGQWMLAHHLLTNPRAVADASTDELLAGQGP